MFIVSSLKSIVSSLKRDFRNVIMDHGKKSPLSTLNSQLSTLNSSLSKPSHRLQIPPDLVARQLHHPVTPLAAGTVQFKALL